MSWATAGEVESITGQAVTAGQLAVGQSVIDLHANRTEGASGVISARDLGWLKAAVAWQAVWQKDQPGFSARSDVTTSTTDGQSNTYRGPDSITLAPLAQRALKNVSWKKSRSLRTPSVFAQGGQVSDPLLDAADDEQEWRALP